ncbi:MAG: HIT family protein [Bernardetiaceae bacterium]
MPSIFTKIIAGDIPCHCIAETADCFAFLDIRPLKAGHTLVIPKKEVDYLFDLDDQDYLALHRFAKEIALALKAAIPCTRIATAVLGLEVPHAHIHLVPIDHESDLRFSNPRVALTQEEFAAIADKIRGQL